MLMLEVHSVGGGKGTTIAGTEIPYPGIAPSLFWSPDGDAVGFFSSGHLRKINLRGGMAEEIGDARSGHGGTWSRFGLIVFAPTAKGPLYSVSSSGGTPTQVTKLDKSRGEFSHRMPWFLPDGIHFLYLAISNKPENCGIWVGSTDSQERIFLMQTSLPAIFSLPDHLLFIRGPMLMAQPFDPYRLMVTGSSFPVARNLRINGETHFVAFSASNTGALAYRNEGAAAVYTGPVKEMVLPTRIDPRGDVPDTVPR